jgi:hypothetical protein
VPLRVRIEREKTEVVRVPDEVGGGRGISSSNERRARKCRKLCTLRSTVTTDVSRLCPPWQYRGQEIDGFRGLVGDFGQPICFHPNASIICRGQSCRTTRRQRSHDYESVHSEHNNYYLSYLVHHSGGIVNYMSKKERMIGKPNTNKYHEDTKATTNLK